MGKHKGTRRKMARHQRIRDLKYRLNLIKLWIHDQLTDLPDIINELKRK